MGDVLSQNEIDNLLAALSTGELDVDEIKDNNEKKVKEYDFARPSKFSKEHLRTMEMIFEHYGRLLSTNLPVYLRKNVQVEVVNSEAVTYSEFSNALSNPVLLGIVNFAPLMGNIILEMASNLGYAIVDRMLPIIDGLTIIKAMREKGIRIPVIIITGMSTLDNKIEGLDGGADDYLVKPFHIKELLARVRALTRRPANLQLSEKMSYEDLTFDKENRILSSPVKSLQLTAKEAELLSILIQNPETLFNREQLVAKIWGSSAEVEAGNVDNYISFIRKRLKELQSTCKITTVYGAGYKLEKNHVK